MQLAKKPITIYDSPDIAKYKKTSVLNDVNYEKADVWSIGVVLLRIIGNLSE